MFRTKTFSFCGRCCRGGAQRDFPCAGDAGSKVFSSRSVRSEWKEEVGGEAGRGSGVFVCGSLTRRLPAHSDPPPPPGCFPPPLIGSLLPPPPLQNGVFRLSAPRACFSLLPEWRSILLCSRCCSSVTHFLPL